jgi:endonuclease/exonuclease/phosphatase family metal-dependent hydrolase
VRIATFNVLHGRPLENGRPLPVQAGGEPFVDAVASLDADILALQELDHLQDRSGGVDQASVAATASGAKDWRYASAFHGRWSMETGWTPALAGPNLQVHGPQDFAAVPSHGIALLSRLPVRTWRALRLPAAPRRAPIRIAGRPGLTLVADQPRTALAAVLEGDRGPFTVAAVHLSFVPGWNIRQLLAVHRWLGDLPHPRILLGDFNLIGPLPRLTLARPGRQPWRPLARTPTYPSHRPVVQFDHVLATGIPPRSVRVAAAPLMPISDHRPVVVDLP